MADEAASGTGPSEREVVIRASARRPTRASVNATLARLGVGVEWSQEAVDQLAAASAAAEEYLRARPDQAERLVRDPAALLRTLVEEGLLSTPVDALEAAVGATRKQAGAPEPSDSALRVRFEDPSKGGYG